MPRRRRVTDAGILTAALAGLEAQRGRVEEQISQVRALLGVRRGRKPGRPAGNTSAARRLSAAARKRISDAQKRRWAEFRKRRAAVVA